MIKLVAFDWNGTIFSDTSAILYGVNKVLKLVNLKSVSLKTFQKHFDVPVTKAYIGLGIPEEVIQGKTSEITKTFHSNYEARASHVRTRAFAKQLLSWLSGNNIKSIMFSNHLDEPIKKQLKRLKIEKFFSAILANMQPDMALKGRSKQEKLKTYIRDNKFLASEILVIGDTIEEIEIGQKLGAVTAAITCGNCSTSRLKKAKPDYLINSLREVINIIRRLNYETS